MTIRILENLRVVDNVNVGVRKPFKRCLQLGISEPSQVTTIFTAATLVDEDAVAVENAECQ